jgi:hypothetical protein
VELVLKSFFELLDRNALTAIADRRIIAKMDFASLISASQENRSSGVRRENCSAGRDGK